MNKQKIIIDTDFGFMNDDCTTCLFALQSKILEVLGITIVAGNYSQQQGVTDGLRVLELVERPEVPVYSGAQFPLVHERSTYENKVWGQYGTLTPVIYEMGEPTIKKAESIHAVNFIIDQIRKYPDEVIIVAIGPLTNIAMALRLAPDITHKVKQFVIMGGAIGLLSQGQGNITPSAEFNFWVDPEAAKIVMTSGIPTILVPLNVARTTRFSETEFRRIIAVKNPITNLFKSFLEPYFRNADLDSKSPRLYYALCDQITIAAIIQPDLIKVVPMCVDVDISHTFAYGTSYGYFKGNYSPGKEQWPIDNNLPELEVVTEINVDRFIELYINTLTGNK